MLKLSDEEIGRLESMQQFISESLQGLPEPGHGYTYSHVCSDGTCYGGCYGVCAHSCEGGHFGRD